MADKIDDLENCSRTNNLRIIGLPGVYKSTDLQKICADTIPEALGLNHTCTMERGHRLGILQADRKRPRQVIIIVRYLNYQDKISILKMFWTKREIQVDGHNILLFVEYSAELTKKKKQFSKIC